MKEIGGFLGLELNKKKEYHQNVIRLNTGRSCLRYIIKTKAPKKIYLPLYSCDSIIDIIKKESIDYEYYSINERLEPVINKKIRETEYILYINYFGLKNNVLNIISKKYSNLIADNTQAFFYRQINNVDTFYSPRKFFGVPDGGYLYSDLRLNIKLSKDLSYKRFKHLLLRIDQNADVAYKFYKENENILAKQPLRKMSILTHSILKTIDYNSIEKIRNKNFIILNDYLGEHNELDINPIQNLKGPMVYPFLHKNKNIKRKLIKNKIYIPTYWKEVIDRTKKSDFENYLTKNLIPLPIDQRYNEEDMNKIVKKVLQFI